MEFPEPVIDIAIEPKTKADQDKLGAVLAEAGDGGPVVPGADRRGDGQTLIAGMGELHLEIIVDRLLREFKVEANVGKPQVAYRETITQPVEAEGKYIRQSGGSGQYGHIVAPAVAQRAGQGLRSSRTTSSAGRCPRSSWRRRQEGRGVDEQRRRSPATRWWT